MMKLRSKNNGKIGNRMVSRIKKWPGILLAIGLLIGLAVVSVQVYHHKQEQNAKQELKKDFQSGNKVTQVYRLTSSKRYAKELRRAGYDIPSDGEIWTDGYINHITISENLQMDIRGVKNKEQKDFDITFKEKVDGKNLLITYSFDRSLKVTYRSYNWFNEEGINEKISVSRSDENHLQAIARQEVNKFLKTMYEEIYKE